jgi:hypothetical protein
VAELFTLGMERMQPTPLKRGISIVALVIGTASIIITISALTLDKTLPYRIGPNQYAQYLWTERLSITSTFVAIAAMIFSAASRQRLLFVLVFLSLASLIMFAGGVHSGPDTQAWCYNNLRSIDAAKQQLAQEDKLTNGATVTAEQISKYIDGGFDSLKCAEHGRYIIGPIGTEPRCTVHGSMSEMELGWKKEMNK